MNQIQTLKSSKCRLDLQQDVARNNVLCFYDTLNAQVLHNGGSQAAEISSPVCLQPIVIQSRLPYSI